MKRFRAPVVFSLLIAIAIASSSFAADKYQVVVSNEKSGDLTIISGGDFKVTATIKAGKRPRGLRASPDGKTVYVALSGTPISPPPKLDANGNPIFEKGKDDDDEAKNADKSADGIGVIDLGQKKLLRKISVGSDPEQLALSADGTKLFASNEDVGTASVLDIASGKVEHIIRGPIGGEKQFAVGRNINAPWPRADFDIAQNFTRIGIQHTYGSTAPGAGVNLFTIRRHPNAHRSRAFGQCNRFEQLVIHGINPVQLTGGLGRDECARTIRQKIC